MNIIGLKHYCQKLQGDSPYVVYGLCNPGGRRIRYVGISKHLGHRMLAHVNDPEGIGGAQKKAAWLGLMKRWPRIIILSKCKTEKRARFREKLFIHYHKSKHLLNSHI